MGAGTTGWNRTVSGWGTEVEGWVLFEDEPTWWPARFDIQELNEGPGLVIALAERPDFTFDLPAVTELVEILDAPEDCLPPVTGLAATRDAPEGYQHLEIGVRHRHAQAVWPAAFTAEVLAALHRTVASPVDPVAAAFHAPVGNPAVGRKAKPGRPRAALIGALVLVGCGALIIGVLSLHRNDPTPAVRTAEEKPAGQTDATTSTVAASGATGPALTTTAGSQDPCAGDDGTTATSTAVDGCEPG